MSQPNPITLLTAAQAAVAEASALCQRVAADPALFQHYTKPDNSPVSTADYAAQALVLHRLTESLGSVQMIAEESAASLASEASPEFLRCVVNAVRTAWPQADKDAVLRAIDHGNTHSDPETPPGAWTLDPIDGTRGYLRGAHYAVCLAWIDNGRPEVCAMGCPRLAADADTPPNTDNSTGSLFWASLGNGAFSAALPLDDFAPVSPLRTSGVTDPSKLRLCESAARSYSDQGVVGTALTRLGAARAPRLALDSQAKYAVVARGQADLLLRVPSTPGKEWIWDHAAGALLAQEAGCAVGDLAGNPLDFGRGAALNANDGVLVTATDALRTPLVRAIAEARASHT